MKIENEKLNILEIKLESQGDRGFFVVPSSGKKYELNKLQFSYLSVLVSVGSVRGLVEFYLGQGWLVSFVELWALLEFLVREKVVFNRSLSDFFNGHLLNSITGEQKLECFPTGKLNHLELPFFRSLSSELASFLLQKVSRIKVASGTRVITSGARDRDLYYLVNGKLGVYRVFSQSERLRVAVFESGALFGEKGFFLNQKRSGDIIAIEDSEILQIQHLPEFDTFIKTEKARVIQQRFFVLQALQSSDFFRDLPDDSIDQLIFSGVLLEAPGNRLIFQEGSAGNSCFILVQGSVVISQKGKSINVLSQGACFGEISLMRSGGVRTATAVTQQDTVLMEIKQSEFYRILSQNLMLARDLEIQADQSLERDRKRKI